MKKAKVVYKKIIEHFLGERPEEEEDPPQEENKGPCISTIRSSASDIFATLTSMDNLAERLKKLDCINEDEREITNHLFFQDKRNTQIEEQISADNAYAAQAEQIRQKIVEALLAPDVESEKDTLPTWDKNGEITATADADTSLTIPTENIDNTTITDPEKVEEYIKKLWQLDNFTEKASYQFLVKKDPAYDTKLKQDGTYDMAKLVANATKTLILTQYKKIVHFLKD